MRPDTQETTRMVIARLMGITLLETGEVASRAPYRYLELEALNMGQGIWQWVDDATAREQLLKELGACCQKAVAQKRLEVAEQDRKDQETWAAMKLSEK